MTDFDEKLIKEQRDTIEQLVREGAQMRGALLLIAEWKAPPIGAGSNGDRDFFRAIAQQGLDAHKTWQRKMTVMRDARLHT